MSSNYAPEGKKRVNLWLDEKLIEDIKRFAALNGKSVPKFVEEILRSNVPQVVIHNNKSKKMSVEFISDNE